MKSDSNSGMISGGARTKKPKPAPLNPPIADVESLSSVTECTGLTPSAVLTEGQAEDYARLYAIHRQKRNTMAVGERGPNPGDAARR